MPKRMTAGKGSGRTETTLLSSKVADSRTSRDEILRQVQAQTATKPTATLSKAHNAKAESQSEIESLKETLGIVLSDEGFALSKQNLLKRAEAYTKKRSVAVK